jgi:pimeloyl-ACP methyl ester carboxylesterase
MGHRSHYGGWLLLSTLGATAALLVCVVPAAAAPAAARASECSSVDCPVRAAPVLAWKPCAGPAKRGFECATARRVPLDYRRPRGARIRLAVIRHRATDRARRLGSLFFNPGGPGEPGADVLPTVLDAFPDALRARFDLVSWDPRGVGRSTAVQCFPNKEAEDGFFAGVPEGFPVGRSEQRAWIRGFARFGRFCARRNGRLLEHVSTADTARDLDLLRRAVGNRRLNYLGSSYGTFLGATYANLFPRRVGRLVLIGNQDPVAWTRRGKRRPFLSTFLRSRADKAAAETLRAFLDLCGRAETAQCAFSANSPAATRAKWTTLLGRLREQPVTVGTPPEAITYAKLASRMVEGLYGLPGWTALAELLQSAWTRSEPEGPPSAPTAWLPDLRLGAPRASASAEQPNFERFAGLDQQYAVICAESPNPRPRAFPRLAALAFARAREAGLYWSWIVEPCGSWPARAADRYAGPWNRPTAHPVLVINNTFDPATPHRGAVAMSRRLARARLLTVDGYGHALGGSPSSCVNRYMSDYFIEGMLPPRGTRCRQDRQPFSPAP